MYFGNSHENILEYDGITWNRISMPGQTYVLSMASGPNGTIYVGGIDDFGQLVPDKNGQLTYQSLAALIEDTAAVVNRVWKVYATETSVYFCTAGQNIFEYTLNGSTVKPTKLPQDSFWSFQINNRILTSNYSLGLLELINGSFNPVKGGEFFKEKDIFSILEWADDTLLIATREDGLHFYNESNGSVNKFNHTITAISTNKTLISSGIYAGTNIGDSLFVFGTHSDGLFIIDRKGQIVNHLNESLGLQNETITNVYSPNDDSGLLWLTLANGITSVNISSPTRYFADESGLFGAIYGIASHRDSYYIGTMQGLF